MPEGFKGIAGLEGKRKAGFGVLYWEQWKGRERIGVLMGACRNGIGGSMKNRKGVGNAGGRV